MLVLTGCWNRRELNEFAIVGAIGIDKNHDTGNYLFSVQVINPAVISAKGGGEGLRNAPVTLYKIETNSMLEGVRRLTTSSPRKLYFAHLRILVISEAVAREGVGHILDLFSRDHEYRPDFHVIVSRNAKAHEVLSQVTTIEKIPANKLFVSLEMSEKHWAPTLAVHLDEWESSLISKGKQPVLTGVIIQGEKEKIEDPNKVQHVDPTSLIAYSGIGVFHWDKLIGWLNETESKGYNYIVGNVKSTVGHNPCPDDQGNYINELIRSRTEMKATVIDGKPAIQIKIKAEGNVAEVLCNLDLNDPNIIPILERRTEKEIKKIIEKTLHKVQKRYRSDIFGFGEVVHRADPVYWKQVENRWDQIFPDVPVSIDVKLNLRRAGTKLNSYMKQIESVKEK